MSTDQTPLPAPTPARRRRKKEDKKSLWQMDLGSLGKKDEQAVEDQVEHAPFQPTLPHVNLLPQAIHDSIAVRKVRRNVVLAVVLVLIVSAGVWWLQGSRISSAQAELTAASAENAQLKKDLDGLAPVQQMYDQITRLQGIVTTTMASQPEAAVVIDRLAAAAAAAGGSAIDFANIDVTYGGIPTAGGPVNPCPNPNPFGSDVTVGCINFTATANDRDQVSAFLRALEADALFVGPYVTSSTVADLEGAANQISFAGSTGVSLEALKTQLTDEQIAALLTPPAPEPAASPSAQAGAQ